MKQLRPNFFSSFATRNQGSAAARSGLRDGDGGQAKQLVEEGAVLLDVRSPAEFASGYIPGAINIPHTQLAQRLDEVRAAQGGDAETAVVIYCRSGGRAGIAKQILVGAGFTRVLNLGGIHDWPR
jgi:phage shock protein E